ncbi:MAG TPA: hypothetical protein VFX24_14040 [Ktedonobacterales bacterium]|jgi:hypothetical protein|nr:hypothetical protein [Ktedonobacterales bacterium]
MIDQRLWNTHIHLREQQFMREAENDWLASECQRIHHNPSPLAVVLRQAFTVFRARMAAAHAGIQPGEAQYPTRDENAAAILAEAEDIARLHWAEPSSKSAHTLSDCACDPC